MSSKYRPHKVFWITVFVMLVYFIKIAIFSIYPDFTDGFLTLILIECIQFLIPVFILEKFSDKNEDDIFGNTYFISSLFCVIFFVTVKGCEKLFKLIKKLNISQKINNFNNHIDNLWEHYTKKTQKEK